MSEATTSLSTPTADQHEGRERRVAVRYSSTLQTLCQTGTARPDEFWWWGKVRDISTSGISLFVRRPFEPGTQLTIEPLSGGDSVQTLLARVVRSTKQTGGGWLLGCEFVCPPADQSKMDPSLMPALQG